MTYIDPTGHFYQDSQAFGYGTKSTDVYDLQLRLKELGFKGRDGKELKPDGDFGDNTLWALNAYKNKMGLKNDTKDTTGKIGATTWKSLGLMFQKGSAYAQASTVLPNKSNLSSITNLSKIDTKNGSNGQGITNNGAGNSSDVPVNSVVKTQDKKIFGSGIQQSYEYDKIPPIDAGIFVVKKIDGVSNKQMTENGTVNIITESKGISVEVELYTGDNNNIKFEFGTGDKKLIFIKPSNNGNGFPATKSKYFSR